MSSIIDEERCLMKNYVTRKNATRYNRIIIMTFYDVYDALFSLVKIYTFIFNGTLHFYNSTLFLITIYNLKILSSKFMKKL